jgi:hypothetical protein
MLARSLCGQVEVVVYISRVYQLGTLAFLHGNNYSSFILFLQRLIIATMSQDAEKTPALNGTGTEEDPFIVEFQKDDPSNPMNWGQVKKWFLTAIVTFSVFAVTFTSSAYSVSAGEIKSEFNISTTVFITGVSVFVLGFAIGPAVWGPLVSFSCRHFEAQTANCCFHICSKFRWRP